MSTSLDIPALRVLRLLAAAEGPLSGEAAARQLNISRTAVWKQINILRGYGYTITSHGRNGYRLVEVPNAAVPTEVLPRLRTRSFGHAYHYLATTPSTNPVLSGLADRGAPEGTVVIAERQEAGRGRMSRGWFSPPDAGLYFSLLLRPTVDVARVTSLPLVIGLAIADALAPHLPVGEPRVKWPNDIWIGGRKVCGILCELQAEIDGVQHVVAGVGINVNLDARALPVELRSIATSLKMAAGVTVQRAELLASLLDHLERGYAAWQRQGLAPFLKRLRDRDVLLGRSITVERAAGALSGTADGVNPDGSLRLRLPDGRIESIYSGDAHVRRSATLADLSDSSDRIR